MERPKIIRANPPLIALIEQTFPIKGREILFAWGDTIYNPAGIDPIPEALIRHELVHMHRQGSYVTEWWQKYLTDPEFRLMEEIPAHVVEYGAWIATPGISRTQRRFVLRKVAERLSSQLYGGLVTFAHARDMIKRLERESRGTDPERSGLQD